MDLAAVRKIAKEALKGACRVCPVCDGRACVGEVPGMGGTGTGASFFANVQALKRYRLNLRTIHGVKSVDTGLELFGRKLALPVLGAPMTGTTYNMNAAITEAEFARCVVDGCLKAGTLSMTGDGADPAMYQSGLDAIQAAGGAGVPIIKPRSQEDVIKRVREAEAVGAVAVGMDVDGAGLITMALKGQPVGPKTFEEIRELAALAKAPFVVKGVMTVDEAELAVRAGACAIVVSNHGGRVLDHTPGSAEVLPAIAAKVKGRIAVLADGAVRTGIDVLKMLALGADAVLIGRPLVWAAVGGGADGVAAYLEKIKNELVSAMLLTAVPNVREVSPAILSPAPAEL
ncbi:alpha-hydroxy-acid oxidizing protein [Fundidesulfovibrio butyratiphilus]